MNILQDILDFSSAEKKTIQQRALKLSEEVGELSEAILSSTGAPGCSYKDKTNSNVIEEAVDVMVVAISILQAAGVSKMEDLIAPFQQKLLKWQKFSKSKDE